MHKQSKILALAFSGGLDTSYCVAKLQDEGWAVHTVFVDTGGHDAGGRRAIKQQADALGAAQHHEIDARQRVFDRFVSVLIRGNVLRGEVYPLSVAAERTQQALSVVETARAIGAQALAHGSTGAGNDQVRFDIAFRVLAPELPILTPIRDGAMDREQTIEFLQQRGFPVPARAVTYSVNEGLWGTTLGGGWTHDSWAGPPETWLDAADPLLAAHELVIGWEAGLPISLDGERMAGPLLVEHLGQLTSKFGIGRNIHLGETALGIKGRIGFEAGAAIVLIHAHRELEKVVLTRWQIFWKDQLSRFYGDRLHEGHWFDPALRDIEALIGSSQQRVTGETRIRLASGRFHVVGVRSPHSLIDPEIATYGEVHRLWSGAEARAYARISAIPDLLAAKRG
jgi:argininosuccinate synthase